MFWIDHITAVANRPAMREVVSKERTYATNGDPAMGVPATILTADFINIIQDELLNVTEAAGQEPDKLDNKQLLKALRWMLAKALGREEWNETSTVAGPSIPLWDPNLDYTLPYIVWGKNNELYTAEQPSGPNTRDGNGVLVGFKDPTATTGFWKSYREQVSGDAGDIKLFSCHFTELKKPWIFTNGDVYQFTSPIGKALQALPEPFKARWRIVADATGINVPDLFVNGKGCFLRAVDGSSRQPGSIEQDAARAVLATANSNTTTNISGSGGALGTFNGAIYQWAGIGATGALSQAAAGGANTWGAGSGGGVTPTVTTLNASGLANGLRATSSTGTTVTIQQTNVAAENRPLNFGMTPAICLPGV